MGRSKRITEVRLTPRRLAISRLLSPSLRSCFIFPKSLPAVMGRPCDFPPRPPPRRWDTRAGLDRRPSIPAESALLRTRKRGNRLIHHPSPPRADVGKRRNPARVRPSQGEQELESDNQALASRVAGRHGTVPHALVRRVPRLRAPSRFAHAPRRLTERRRWSTTCGPRRHPVALLGPQHTSPRGCTARGRGPARRRGGTTRRLRRHPVARRRRSNKDRRG